MFLAVFVYILVKFLSLDPKQILDLSNSLYKVSEGVKNELGIEGMSSYGMNPMSMDRH